jgi:beta-carotene 3-hydroxylase
MTGLAHAAIFLGVLAGMEAVAYLMHKHLMHGPLWFLHKSHHRPRQGWFELNDLFGIFFAIPSMILIYIGVRSQPGLLWAGLGMTAYGVFYFGFHDVLVHRRIRHRFFPRGGYLRRLVQAHLIHHKTLGRDGAVSFGFLYAPPIETLTGVRGGPS